MNVALCSVGQRRGGGHRARAQGGAAGRAGGAVARGARGQRRGLLRLFVLLVAQLRHRPARQHRGELAGRRVCPANTHTSCIRMFELRV